MGGTSRKSRPPAEIQIRHIYRDTWSEVLLPLKKFPPILRPLLIGSGAAYHLFNSTHLAQKPESLDLVISGPELYEILCVTKQIPEVILIFLFSFLIFCFSISIHF